jgi:hypothetical protein
MPTFSRCAKLMGSGLLYSSRASFVAALLGTGLIDA